VKFRSPIWYISLSELDSEGISTVVHIAINDVEMSCRYSGSY